MKVWKVELNDLLERIERHTSASLWRIKREFERSGLTFDRKFRKRFLRLTNNRLSETYDRVEIESMATDPRNRGHQHHHQQPHHHRYLDESDRNLHHHYNGLRQMSVEREPYPKKNTAWTEKFKVRSLYSDRPSKYERTAQRLGGVHKRLGKKISDSADDQTDVKSGILMQSSNGIPPQHDGGNGGRNPFRSANNAYRSVATVTTPDSMDASQSMDDKDPLQMIKVKIERHSPVKSASHHNGVVGGGDGSRPHETPGCSSSKRMREHDETECDSDEVTVIQTPAKRQKIDDTSIDLDATATVNDMIFYCVHCTDGNALNESCYGSIEDVYGHWLSGHTDLHNVKPFWFYVTQSMACFHCTNVTANYHDMIKHHQEMHAPDTAFVVVRPSNRKECALCTYIGDDMCEHFASEHDGLLQSNLFNPARLPESLLGDLFAIDIHKKRQCGWCNGIFETHHEVAAHHIVAHTNQLLNAKEYFDGKSAYVICDACSSKVDGTKFFTHIEKHAYQFECSKCPFKSGQLIDLVAHEKDEHRKNSLNYHCMEFGENLKKQFFNSKVIFGNGLVLINHNFKNTIYDDSKQFDTFIERLVDKIKAKYSRMVAAAGTAGGASNTADGNKYGGGKLNLSRPSSVASSSNASFDPMASDRMRSPHSIDSHRNPFRVSSLSSNQERGGESIELTELQKQNQLDNNLSIIGLPQSRDHSVLEMFLKYCKKIKADVSANDVLDIYRDGGDINDTVIVKFKNYELKNMVRNYAQLRLVWTNELVELPPGEMASKIFTNLHTTRYYGKMLNIAREARKSDSLFSYYLCKRGLAVRRTENSSERIVLSTSELINYIYGNKHADGNDTKSPPGNGERSTDRSTK